jgi:threonine dehydrogenase-like Zn-dependent dehydrogenase
MNCLWLENKALAIRQDEPVPQPSPKHALIKLLLAGICSTDLEMVRGYYPFTGIPGHEFVGQVVDVPGDAAAAESWTGKRVVGEINLTCGECEACQNGRPTHCERRSTLGIHAHQGVFAEYLTLPAKNLHVIPDHVPDEAAVFTEPLAAALEILEQVSIRPTDRVLVVGAGRLGLLIAQTLALTGCELAVAVRRDAQRQLLEGWNIHALAEAEIPVGRMDVVVDATGSPGGFALARRALRPRGVLVLKSTYAGDMEVNFSSLVVDEITLVGSRCGPFAPALGLLARRQVDPLPLIQGRFSLVDGLQAFEYAAQPGVLKVLLQP